MGITTPAGARNAPNPMGMVQKRGGSYLSSPCTRAAHAHYPQKGVVKPRREKSERTPPDREPHTVARPENSQTPRKVMGDHPPHLVTGEPRGGSARSTKRINRPLRDQNVRGCGPGRTTLTTHENGGQSQSQTHPVGNTTSASQGLAQYTPDTTTTHHGQSPQTCEHFT